MFSSNVAVVAAFVASATFSAENVDAFAGLKQTTTSNHAPSSFLKMVRFKVFFPFFFFFFLVRHGPNSKRKKEDLFFCVMNFCYTWKSMIFQDSTEESLLKFLFMIEKFTVKWNVEVANVLPRSVIIPAEDTNIQ